MNPTLDLDALARLGEDLGDDELLLELAQELVAALPDRVATVRAAAAAGAAEPGAEDEGRRAAHTLKSSARLLGLVDLGEHAAHLEASAPHWSPDVLARLDRLAADGAAALRAWADLRTRAEGSAPR